MFVACSTLCFTKEPLESALRHIVELEFNKVDLAIVEDSPHLRPSDVAENAEAALHRIRYGPSLSPSALQVDFGNVDPPTLRKRFEAICRFCKPLNVAVIAMPAAPAGTSIEDETARLRELTDIARREGIVPTIETNSQTVTADPEVALDLCKTIPGLGLTLDPSHYLQGPHAGANYDDLFPYVQNVHLRDTGRKPGEFQVRIGQGTIEYGRLVNQLERYGYNRALTVAIHDAGETPFDVEVEVRKLKLLLESLI